MKLTPTQKTIIRLMREGAFIYGNHHSNQTVLNKEGWRKTKKCSLITLISLLKKEMVKPAKDFTYTLTDKGRMVNID